MTDEAANDQLQSFDSSAMPWGELYIDRVRLFRRDYAAAGMTPVA